MNTNYVGRHRLDAAPDIACTCTVVITAIVGHRVVAPPEFDAHDRLIPRPRQFEVHHEWDCAIMVERAERLHLTLPAGDGTLRP